MVIAIQHAQWLILLSDSHKKEESASVTYQPAVPRIFLFSFLPRYEKEAYSMRRATFLSSDRPSIHPSVRPLNILYKKACHVFTIQDIDLIFSGYLHDIKTQKLHKNFL